MKNWKCLDEANDIFEFDVNNFSSDCPEYIESPYLVERFVYEKKVTFEISEELK